MNKKQVSILTFFFFVWAPVCVGILFFGGCATSQNRSYPAATKRRITDELPPEKRTESILEDPSEEAAAPSDQPEEALESPETPATSEATATPEAAPEQSAADLEKELEGVAANPSASPSTSPSGQRIHKVWIWQENGDCLSAIAKKYYGDGSQWKRIYDANQDQIADPAVIYPKQELVIP